MGKPSVAIIGAGLAGLSAAYHLREELEEGVHVTIFEKERRIGGRVFTSQDPPGEHGAEFLLRSEKKFCRLLEKDLGLTLIRLAEWPWYQWGRRYASGDHGKAASKLLSKESARLVNGLFKRIGRGYPKKDVTFRHWLSTVLQGDHEAMRFVEMLLISETCAPIDHIPARDGYGGLWSLLEDEWYRIRGGSEALVRALRRQSQAHVELGACVDEVVTVRGGVRIRWKQNGQEKSGVFQAVIITTPDGERLLGRRPQGCYHAYISVLLAYRKRPSVKGHPAVDLTKGLYTDGPLNYQRLAAGPSPPYGLRILIPNAEAKLRWTKQRILDYCVSQLKPIIFSVEQYVDGSVAKWKFGLPCRGRKEPFLKVGRRIFLAGDRFGEWPSMATAVSSGCAAAQAVANGLRQEEAPQAR
jgi:phytoene dehydrogenase-like protein